MIEHSCKCRQSSIFNLVCRRHTIDGVEVPENVSTDNDSYEEGHLTSLTPYAASSFPKAHQILALAYQPGFILSPVLETAFPRR